MSETLKEKTARGLFWGAMNSGTTQLLNLVIGIFLARLLSPADYGIVGVLTIFTLIAGNLQSSGFTQGLINLKQPTANDYNSVFWFNVLSSLSIYAVLFCCAPLIARFFHQPCLTSLSRFVFLGFVVSAFGIAQNAYMTKNMMNREMAIAGIVALVVSGITGIVLALNKMAYWSLAWQQIAYIGVLNLGRYYYTSWRPSLHIDFTPVRQMFSFSVKILVTNIINTVSSNILTFIFGRLFPIKAVGNYSQAYKWDTMANSFVSGTLSQIAQPVLASIQGEREREVRVFRKMLCFTAFLSFPAMFGLALVSEEFIMLTLSAKWAASIPLLQILCISGAFVPFYTLYQNLAISNGRSDIYMWCNIAQIAVQIGLVLLFAPYGMTVMVTVYTVFTILWLLVWQYFAHRISGLRLFDVLKDILPFMVTAAAAMAVAGWATQALSGFVLLLAVRMAIAAILYVAAMKLLHAEIMEECLQYVFHKAKSTE